jgi:hypothetical protein
MSKDPEVLMTIILVIVIIAMNFWRTVFKLAVAIIVTLILLGLIQLLQSLH